MYLVKTPKFIQSLFPNFTWSIPTESNEIFLTFDDGPIPEVTYWVVEQLNKFNAKATFFCVGDNVKKHPNTFQYVLENGHTVGNHTFNHLNGWETDNLDYFHNIRHCARLVKNNLFRPPYGRLKPAQALFLQKHYNIVMWSILSGDFDNDITQEQCLNNVLENTEAGSIVVFHDSLKAFDKLSYVLPKFLEHFSALGYSFNAIEAKTTSNFSLNPKIA